MSSAAGTAATASQLATRSQDPVLSPKAQVIQAGQQGLVQAAAAAALAVVGLTAVQVPGFWTC